MRINDDQFKNEEDLRNWLVEEFQKKISAERLNFRVLDSKNVNDILICKENISHPALVFIEIKLYKTSHNRIHIGDRKGKGFQPEILSKRFIYFDRYLRWFIASEKGECVFVNNEVLSKYLMRKGIKEGKHNNIDPTILEKENPASLSSGIEKIIKWLKMI